MDLMPRGFYLDSIFNDLVSKGSNDMKCDIYERDGDYHIVMDIPGFDKKDISIEAKNGYLTITATKNMESEEEDKDKNYIRRERSYGKYERSFYLGDLDADNISAEFKNGTLKVLVPHKEANENKKVIEIKD